MGFIGHLLTEISFQIVRHPSVRRSSPAAAWITDEEGRFEYASPAYRRMFQIREVDIVGKQANEVHPAALAGLPRIHSDSDSDSDSDNDSRHDELIDVVKTGLRGGGAAR